jgi:hypothetical protein
MRPTSAVGATIGIVSTILLSWFFGGLGTFAGMGWTLLLVILQNYDKALQISAFFLAQFSRISNWSERRAVVNFLQGTINLSASKINSESEGLLPHGVKVEIVKRAERDAFLREGQVVVCMESSRSQARNLARATLFYVAEDLVRDSRRFIDRIVMRACDFALARKMLMADHRVDALKSFNDEFLDPETKREPSIRPYVLGMDEMDSNGTLTRILLREFSELGTRLSPKLSDIEAEQESKSFADKLIQIARKQPGIDIDTTHEGQIIRAGVMLVARAEVVDIEPHVKYARQCFSRKIPILYVLARGDLNIIQAKMTVREIESLGLYRGLGESDFTVTYTGGTVKCYIVRCAVGTQRLSTQTEQ